MSSNISLGSRSTDPGQLPSELFDMIYDDAFSNIQSADFTADLSQMCKFNRSWHRHLTPRLYSCFACDGDIDRYQKLWWFWRTIVMNDNLAAMVRRVDIRDCDGPCPRNTFLGTDKKAIEGLLDKIKWRGLESLR